MRALTLMCLLISAPVALPAARGAEMKKDAGLLAHYALDEGSGSTAVDSSGYGHDGTLINTNFTSTTPTTIAFNNTHALEFDGTNEYVDVTANPKD